MTQDTSFELSWAVYPHAPSLLLLLVFPNLNPAAVSSFGY